MIHLVLASLLFSASFGLIHRHLSGVDPTFVAFARLALSFLAFAPFLRPSRTPARDRVALALVGAVQFGLMYVLYQRAYEHLAGHEVALFTVITPLHVLWLHALLTRSLGARDLLAAILAVLAALVLAWRRPDAASLGVGFLLVQAANLAFAAGQVLYRRRAGGIAMHGAGFAWAYLGGASVAGAAFATSAGGSVAAFPTTAVQWAVIAWLGLVPAGLGFFLWNVGATRVPVGVLAVANNLKSPLGVLVALVVFREAADPLRLGASIALIGASFAIASRRRPAEPSAA